MALEKHRDAEEIAEAFMTHANLLLRIRIQGSIPHSELMFQIGMTPHEPLKVSNPDVSNLLTFGCRMYTVIPEKLQMQHEKASINMSIQRQNFPTACGLIPNSIINFTQDKAFRKLNLFLPFKVGL